MQDLQSLLEKINRDGVEKAEQEAARIIHAAKEKSDSILNDARAQADKLLRDAEESSRRYAEHATETVKQAARDTVLKVELSIKSLLEKILLDAVKDSMSDDVLASELVAGAVREIAGEGEIVCGEKLAKALCSKLSGSPFTVSMDETFGSGFSVRTDNGRIESSFTAEVIAGELAKRLRPELAKLVTAAL